MGKISVLAGLALVFAPAAIVRLFAPKRDVYRGAMIDAKAYAVGQLAKQLRAPDALPTVAESREQLLKSAKLFDAKGPQLARVEDLQINGNNGLIAARLYSDHRDISLKRPALVYYHGGGFIQGSIDSHDALCRKIAKWWGGIVVAVDYRLAPEHPYPAGVNDAISGYLSIVEKAAELGIDPLNVGVGGDSAGGCFAAVTCQQVAGMQGPVPAFQVLLYPVTDGNLNAPSIIDLTQAYILPKLRMDWYRDEYAGKFTDFDNPKFSPLAADDLTGQPPCFLLTGGFDPLMDDGKAYGDKLQAAGVQVTHRHYAGQVHAFVNMTKVVPEGAQAIQDLCKWLRALVNQHA